MDNKDTLKKLIKAQEETNIWLKRVNTNLLVLIAAASFGCFILTVLK